MILSPACPKAQVLTLARLDYSSKSVEICVKFNSLEIFALLNIRTIWAPVQLGGYYVQLGG